MENKLELKKVEGLLNDLGILEIISTHKVGVYVAHFYTNINCSYNKRLSLTLNTIQSPTIHIVSSPFFAGSTDGRKDVFNEIFFKIKTKLWLTISYMDAIENK